jgi:hypothetical protein
MSDNYPFNIQPQPRLPENPGSMPILKCPPDTSAQAVILDNSSLCVIKGWESKGCLPLKEFWIPVNTFQQSEQLLPMLGDGTTYHWEIYHHTDDTFVTLDYGMMKDTNGGVQFICIYPLYANMTLDAQTSWKINWRFQGDTEWKEMGRIFMYDAGPTGTIPPLELQNNMGEDVYLKILYAN